MKPPPWMVLSVRRTTSDGFEVTARVVWWRFSTLRWVRDQIEADSSLVAWVAALWIMLRVGLSVSRRSP